MESLLGMLAHQCAGRCAHSARTPVVSSLTLMNSRCPPRSQIENVMFAFRMLTVFSMKFTPSV